MVKSSSGKVGLRSFSVLNVGKHGGCKTKFNAGRYLGRNPVSAAKKAFNNFCRQKKIRGVCTLIVTVKETTQGSKNKEFSYKLHRKKLAKPMVMLEGTKNEFVIEYQKMLNQLILHRHVRNKDNQEVEWQKRLKEKTDHQLIM